MFSAAAFLPSSSVTRWLASAIPLVSALTPGHAACATTGDTPATATTAAIPGKSPMEKIKTIVVIYAENRSFDNLYGLYPGADGIAQALQNPATYQQVDRDGKTVLPHLPPVHATHAMGAKVEQRWAFVGNLPNKPFLIDADQPGGEPGVSAAERSPDLVHRFYNNQMQIRGGRNDMFAAWSNAGGLTMGYYSGKSMKMWQLAQKYTLADHFFMGGFGGSFFNHQFLISASPPVFADPPKACLSAVDDSGNALTLAKKSPPSALDGPPWWINDATLTPDGFAVNTMQPAYQPSTTAPPKDGDPRLADPTGGGNPQQIPLPPQTRPTIGDTLTAKGVPWKWYSGAWNQALADRSILYNEKPGFPNFQTHHQPFNYFKRFDPTTPDGAAERSAHLKDYTDLLDDIKSGTLPPVAFYKPPGNLTQHPGYADVMSGDAHVADLVAQLQAGPQWKDMLIIVTYDENGGFFDHVPPPKGDRWGPGTRIPAIIISPFAKKASVDHTTYDTTSILKLITRRFNLDPLPGARPQMGDLTAALEDGGS